MLTIKQFATEKSEAWKVAKAPWSRVEGVSGGWAEFLFFFFLCFFFFFFMFFLSLKKMSFFFVLICCFFK